ncbi:MAG: hypothetical protein KUG79_16305 [Pseudomonadales bacterium]|nr:hypothetical protein [Pseudomonadales bacterium]
MTLHRLEVYLDTYASEPFIKDFENVINPSTKDEQNLQDWLSRKLGRIVNIEKELSIEDVRHQNTTPKKLAATSLRVTLSKH